MDVLWAILFGIAGLLVGWLYFAIMRHSVVQFTERKGGVLAFTGLVLVRALLFIGGAVVAVTVLDSTWALIAYVLGFILARTVVVGKARKERRTG